MSTADSAVEHSPVQQRSVGIADYAVTTGNVELTTSGLGSCVGIALFDEIAGVAGLIHVKLPESDEIDDAEAATFVDTGIELLVEEMEREGGSRHRMDAKIAGGSDMFGFSAAGSGLGARNVEQVETVLADLGIPIVGRDVGGEHARTVSFDGRSGKLTVEGDAAEKQVL